VATVLVAVACFQWFYWGFLSLVAIPGVEAPARVILPKKTEFSLTFQRVQLTNWQSAQNFEHLFFAQMKEEFNPHFRGFFGTNWDKFDRL
jgi:hypothetical protein